MKIKLLAFFLVFSIYDLRAEPWPKTSIFDLCMYSDVIVEAELQSISDAEYMFTYKEYGKKNAISKELKLSHLKNYFAIDKVIENRHLLNQLRNQLNSNHLTMPGLDTVSFDNADRILMFLSLDEKKLKPFHNGVRIIKNNMVYLPMQLEIPGKYSFVSEYEIAENDFIHNLNQKILITNELKKIIFQPSAKQKKQKKELEKWLKTHFVTAKRKTDLPQACTDSKFGLLAYFYENKEGDHLSQKMKNIEVSDIYGLYRD